MPGKKKKGGKKAKGNGGGDAGGLPPPPDFSQNRQGALETMLAFRIKGKSEVIDLYSEEAEDFKDRNYQQKYRNDQIKGEQTTHLKTLVEEAKMFTEKLRAAETVTREDVEKAMLRKLDCGRETDKELKLIEEKIVLLDCELEKSHEELDEMTTYKDVIQHDRRRYIDKMKQTMKNWEATERKLKDKIALGIENVKMKVDQKFAILSELQKERISERLLHAMDNDTKGEMADNLWLKQQILSLKSSKNKIQKEVNEMEQRNLEIMELMYSLHRQELESSQRLFGIPGQHSTPIGASTSGSTLSLTDRFHTSSKTNLKSRPLDVSLISVEGLRMNMRPAPEYVHLPPIEEQQNQSLPRTSWPVTSRMLKSIAT